MWKARLKPALSIVLALCTLASTCVDAPASQTPVAPHAPAFDLPLVGNQGYLRSADLFPFYKYTFLVFWDSGCPRCVRDLVQSQAFFEEHGGEDIAVIGIHPDRGDPFEVERLLGENEIHFPQLWDIGGEMAQDYAVVPETFTLRLVSRDARILAARAPIGNYVKETMQEMLPIEETSSPAPGPGPSTSTPPEESPRPSWTQGFVFHGDERLRFLSIDSRGKAPVGPYGEALEPGNNVIYRFDLEVSRRITRHLRVGGLLRIGNEDEKVLEVGPEYLGSRWGSAFAEVDAASFMVRLGYYEISSTPLTLMRWDWDDNPRIGGNAGCGCGAAAGVLLVESLEELGPDLVFEGGTLSYRRRGLEARAFYAIPRRADKTRYQESAATGAARASYSLELGGAEAGWRRSDSRTGSTWKAGVRYIATWENDRSVDFVKLGYRWPDPWSSSAIVTADWNIPLVRFVDLQGEWIIWNEADENAEACCDTTLAYEGKGGIAGLVFERPTGWRLRLDYIYLDPGFYSPFAALSYEPNREGARGSAQIPLYSERVVASLFYKRLRETEVPSAGAEKEQDSYLGASLDAEFPIGLGGSVGWLDAGRWRKGSVQPVDDVRKALVVGARYRFDKTSTIQIEYQRLKRTITSRGIENESSADLYSVYMSVRF